MLKVNILNEQFFAEVVVRDAVRLLRSIHRAIPKWEQIAATEVDADSQPSENLTDLEAEWHEQHQQDQYYMLDATKNALFGGFAVTQRMLAMFRK